MQLVLATNNQDKITEIRHALEGLPVTILISSDFPTFPDPHESGTNLKENAILKAREICTFTGLPSLADDTGLEVDALGGAPGVYSSRFAGDNATYRDNYEKLLRELKGVPPEKRTARFRCVIAIAWTPNEIQTVDGLAEGVITEDIAGDNGFGYDPVFYYPPLHKRFSEMTVAEKNQVSHRGKAVRAAKELIAARIKSNN